MPAVTELKESEGNYGKLDAELRENVLKDLKKHVPWNQICKRYRISTKTIAKIKEIELENDGGVAAKVFEAFEEGLEPVEVVIKLRVRPDVVLELLETYLVLAGHEKPQCQSCYERGAADTMMKFAFTCKVCGKPAYANLELWQSLVKQGYLSGWGHKGCLEGQ